MHARNLLSPSRAASVAGAALLLAAAAAQAQSGVNAPAQRPAPALVAAQAPALSPQQPISADAPARPAGGRCVPGTMAAIMSAKLPPNARPERLGHSCP